MPLCQGKAEPGIKTTDNLPTPVGQIPPSHAFPPTSNLIDRSGLRVRYRVPATTKPAPVFGRLESGEDHERSNPHEEDSAHALKTGVSGVFVFRVDPGRHSLDGVPPIELIAGIHDLVREGAKEGAKDTRRRIGKNRE